MNRMCIDPAFESRDEHFSHRVALALGNIYILHWINVFSTCDQRYLYLCMVQGITGPSYVLCALPHDTLEKKIKSIDRWWIYIYIYILLCAMCMDVKVGPQNKMMVTTLCSPTLSTRWGMMVVSSRKVLGLWIFTWMVKWSDLNSQHFQRSSTGTFP